MSTQATIRFDVEASTARLGPQLKAGEQQFRMFGQNARAAVGGGSGGGGGGLFGGQFGLGTALGQIGSMTGSGSAQQFVGGLMTAMTPISAMLRSSGGRGAAESSAPSSAAGAAPVARIEAAGTAVGEAAKGFDSLAKGASDIAVTSGAVGDAAVGFGAASAAAVAVPIAVAAGTYAMTQAMANDARNIRQQSLALGVSTDAFQKYGIAARRAGSIPAWSSAALRTSASRSARPWPATRGRWGSSAPWASPPAELQGGDTGELFERAAKSIDAMGGSISATRAEMGAFGQAGRLLNPVLHQIADGIHGTVLSPLELHGLDSMKGSLTGGVDLVRKDVGKKLLWHGRNLGRDQVSLHRGLLHGRPGGLARQDR